MATSSALSLTGQYWKFAFGVTGLLVGSIAPLFQATGMSWTVGSLIAGAGYAFALFAVRCPSCGSRWLWKAALDPAYYEPVFKGSVCPHCKHDFSASN